MREPGSYSRLDQRVQFLKGIGPARAASLSKLGIDTVRDLLRHVPRRYDDASRITPVGSLQVGDEATAIGTVTNKGIVPTRGGRRIFQAIIADDTGMITAAWWGRPHLDRRIEKGGRLLCSGKVRFFHGQQLEVADFAVLKRGGGRTASVPDAEDRASDGGVFVTYPSSQEVPQWVLREAFETNLPAILPWADDDEYLSAEERREQGWPTLSAAFRSLHQPSSAEEVEPARRRLAFDELFILQIGQARARGRAAREAGIRHRRDNSRIRPVLRALPFDLTEAQARALREISADMTSERRMHRLLQGDVGSGKTVVALFAMLIALESGYQSAIMAPTELLAEQHLRSLGRMLQPVGAAPVLLTGGLGAAARREALAATAAGSPVVVGTHALFQESVEFARLGLVVVDEQHRFGVKQRLSLTRRGGSERPDLLVMSATPIPRSLAMVYYGELDISVMDELPAGRRPVSTRLAAPRDRGEVHALVSRELDAGRQAYIVYPLVSQSEQLDLAAAEDEYERLAAGPFADRSLALLHGRLPGAEKERVMREFLAGRIQLLVATTVIEVGIDVPNATVMVIEHAERFGLSQLHQLRGRVGRGGERSHCVLIADAGGASRERLDILTRTEDGFRVAEEDLKIRGPGDLFGSEQHGRVPSFKFADLGADLDLLNRARAGAAELAERDPELEAPEHRTLRRLVDDRFGERQDLFRTG